MFRRPHGWSHLPRPAMAPSPPCSCSKAAWCSSPDCEAPSTEPSLLSWPTHTKHRARCCAHLIDKHQTTSIEGASDHHLPGSSQPFVSFQRPHSPFFRLKPIRLRSLLKVDSL